MSEIMLSAREMAQFNRLLARATATRIAVGPDPISRRQARAVWTAARAFELANVDERGGHSSRRAGIDLPLSGAVVALSAAAALSGCATFGSHVRGDFACRAPDGICAPTSKIDDQALAMIGAGDAGQTPARALEPDGASERRLIPVNASMPPARSSEKVLRIVFPAHVDRAGRYREASAIHAVVERGAWLAADEGPVHRAVAYAGKAAPPFATAHDRPTLADLAAHAPELAFPSPVAAPAMALAPEAMTQPGDPGAPHSVAVVATQRKRQHAGAIGKRHPASGPQAGAIAGAPSAASAAMTARTAVQLASGTRGTVPLGQFRPTLASSGQLAPARASVDPAAGSSPPLPDLRGAGSASPLQAIRNQVTSILAARKPAPMAATAAPASKSAAADQPANAPGVLPVSGIEQ